MGGRKGVGRVRELRICHTSQKMALIFALVFLSFLRSSGIALKALQIEIPRTQLASIVPSSWLNITVVSLGILEVVTKAGRRLAWYPALILGGYWYRQGCELQGV